MLSDWLNGQEGIVAELKGSAVVQRRRFVCAEFSIRDRNENGWAS